jgi:hypothetical protein
MSEDTPKYGSDYVFQAGVFGASDSWKLMGERGGITTDTARTHILSKVAEQLSGHQEQQFSYAIQWGNEHEEDARRYYELAFGCEVDKPAPQSPEWSDEVRCSPDGIIGTTKGLEIKCPFNTYNHVKHMLIRSADDLKKEAKQYYWQIQQCLLIYEFDTWDFVSYDPRFTGWMRMHVVEIGRKEADIAKLKESLLQAVEMKNNIIKRITL